MQKVSFLETIDPATLSQEGLADFFRKLYGIHCQIFSGVSRALFEQKMFPLNAQWTKIRIFKNSKGEDVGYSALHAYEKVINSENIVIFRVETGILRDYRRQGNASSFFLTEAIKYKAVHPFKKSYLFCTLVHPSSYHLISTFFFRFYPNFRYATPSNVLDSMDQMADAFHEVPSSNGDPSLREVGWVTRQTVKEQSEWAGSNDPDTCFFLEKNPDYHKGIGLMTLAPLDMRNIFMTTLLFLCYLGKNLIYRRVENK